MNRRTTSTAKRPAASGHQRTLTAEVPNLADIIDCLYCVIHHTELASMATESLGDARLQNVFAVALDHIGEELRFINRALYANLEQGG